MRPFDRSYARNERGSALVIALLVLMTLAALAVSFMTTVMSERRVAALNEYSGRALNLAEAGVSEAVERIRRGDVPDKLNPKMVSQIYLTVPGSVPEVGTDTTAMATGQATGQWANYTTPTKGPDVLTVSYKTNAGRTQIFKYDSNKNPTIQTATGNPIFVINSVGRVGNVKRRVLAEVASTAPIPVMKGAAVGLKKVELNGDVVLNGFQYQAETPTGVGSDGWRWPEWEASRDSMAGGWSKDKVEIKNTPTLIGNPPKSEKIGNFYAGPWEALNMSMTSFWTWLGPPNPDKKPASDPRGITYHAKSNGKEEDFEYKGNFNGDGFMYVNGDLKIEGDFTFRGMIYVTKKITVHGKMWVLGTVIAKDFHLHAKNSTKASRKGKPPDNNISILASTDAIQKNIAKYGGTMITLAWREVP